MPKNPKLKTLTQLKGIVQKLKQRGKQIVFTNGCFDLLHLGHVRYLTEAKKMGDVLIVGLNSDRSVRALKGPGRPLVPEKERAEMLAALTPVDYIVIFPERTPDRTIQELKPDVHVKGGDYKPDELPEAKVVKAYGGRVVTASRVKGKSTTSLIRKIQQIALTALLISLPLTTHAFTLSRELAREIADKKAYLEKNLDDPHAHFDLAITYAYANKIEEGWEELTRAHELVKKSGRYKSDKEYALNLIEIYQQKIKDNPRDLKARFRLAFALYFGDQKKEAIKQFEEIANLDPKNIWAYGYIGVVYGEQGEIDKGIRSIKKAISIDPEVSSLHYGLGQAYYRKNLAWLGFLETSRALKLKAMGR